MVERLNNRKEYRMTKAPDIGIPITSVVGTRTLLKFHKYLEFLTE